ncbi:MAG TPA: glutaredoxin, partial [Gammaproteobacteria bacterium]|nr:glutaredoxin [Gammaproteobacteria bacterium]
WGEELRLQGGKYQTPCLKITDSDGSVQWMYESKDIIDYLDQRFPTE